MTVKTITVQPVDLANSCEPTQHERVSAKAYLARSKENLPGPRVKVSEKDGVTQIALDHSDLAGAMHESW